MKKCIIVIAAVFCTLGAHAQWGLQGGATFSTFKLSDVSNMSDKLKTSTGYTAGLTYDIGLPLGLGINTGLLFIQRNVEQDGTTGEVLDRFSSLELPLNLKYKFPLPAVTPFVVAGPYLDCGIWAKQGGKKVSYGEDLERFSWGFAMGAGVDLVKTVRVMYQYDWGLTNLNKETDAQAYFKAKNRSHRISLGILF